MAALRFHKVTSLPGTLDADSIYFVQAGAYSETYITDSAGMAKSVGNSAMIQAIVANALADLNTVEVVADIAARNALTDTAPEKTRNLMAMVLDATGDGTVAAGAALYVYREATDTWTKIAEYESMDVTLTWAAISGKPASAVALIDDAVTKRHAHVNQAQLDKIGESGGAITYDGSPVGASWTTLNW
jgi:hypothetical protein